MTAEVAILNKSAVVLAADSAVTISAGSTEQKIFDSEDKLFELSRQIPLAAMINSDMSLMEAPLPVLIKEYRSTAPTFSSVRAAADHFLAYLDEFVQRSPPRIEKASVERYARQLLEAMRDRVTETWNARVFEPGSNKLRQEIIDLSDNIAERFSEIWLEAYDLHLRVIERLVQRSPDAQFVGGLRPALPAEQILAIAEIAKELWPNASADHHNQAASIVAQALLKQTQTGGTTGLVIAGFGTDELFPTLVSFEIFGSLAGRLRFAEREFIDIDRDGHGARVLPFAQREMVERFLYGLDDTIERQITEFCKRSVPDIAQRVLDSLEMDEEDKQALDQERSDAERAFFDGLAQQGFSAIRAESRSEIEDMVEFMPKPEMARMAEALVNLTSIKRRVSRGFETVGGPIDVAVLSKTDGFVWVARKHYFPKELNQRYFDRIRTDG